MNHFSSISPWIVLLVGIGVPLGSLAQKTTRIQGNTEINASSNNTTAVAVGSNVVAKNRVGVVQGDKKGNTRINISTSNVTTIVGGRNKKACTNIGAIVSDECK
ncbi:hypothetical protein [Accumulibacter sp.]|uniref:hypothetical protein n=1 Tax=Accumulibacter sp. TaxID=2053492 RepID=UPI002624F8C6|nr:hypothetical protein [Accumulibacter sp.]